MYHKMSTIKQLCTQAAQQLDQYQNEYASLVTHQIQQGILENDTLAEGLKKLFWKIVFFPRAISTATGNQVTQSLNEQYAYNLFTLIVEDINQQIGTQFDTELVENMFMNTDNIMGNDPLITMFYALVDTQPETKEAILTYFFEAPLRHQ